MADNNCPNILRLFDVLSNFFTPQMKRSAIISDKHGIFELPHELWNDLKLRILENQERSRKSQNVAEWWSSVQSSCQNQSFVKTSKKTLEKQKLTFPVVHYFTWKLELVLNILLIIVDI